MDELKQKILEVFKDSSGRPKKTPRHESSIIIMMEKQYSPGKIITALQKLEDERVLISFKKKIENVGDAKFYYLRQNKIISLVIKKKIDNAAKWIRKYSNHKVTKMLGEHLHDIVKAEIRAQGFEVLGEKTRRYRKLEWTKTNETLDIIAKHQTKNLTIGIENKNMLYLVSKSEIISKIDMCNYFKIKPVFACRWLEPHRETIMKRGGFLWQFERQLYPRGQEKFVNILQKRFKFPVEVSSELPNSAIREFKDWMQRI